LNWWSFIRHSSHCFSLFVHMVVARSILGYMHIVIKFYYFWIDVHGFLNCFRFRLLLFHIYVPDSWIDLPGYWILEFMFLVLELTCLVIEFLNSCSAFNDNVQLVISFYVKVRGDVPSSWILELKFPILKFLIEVPGSLILELMFLHSSSSHCFFLFVHMVVARSILGYIHIVIRFYYFWIDVPVSWGYYFFIFMFLVLKFLRFLLFHICVPGSWIDVLTFVFFPLFSLICSHGGSQINFRFVRTYNIMFETDKLLMYKVSLVCF